MARAIGQVNISASVMHRMPVPLPSLDQQREIAGELEHWKLVSTGLAARAAAEKSTLEELPPALLRRAFQGEL